MDKEALVWSSDPLALIQIVQEALGRAIKLTPSAALQRQIRNLNGRLRRFDPERESMRPVNNMMAQIAGADLDNPLNMRGLREALNAASDALIAVEKAVTRKAARNLFASVQIVAAGKAEIVSHDKRRGRFIVKIEDYGVIDVEVSSASGLVSTFGRHPPNHTRAAVAVVQKEIKKLQRNLYSSRTRCASIGPLHVVFSEDAQDEEHK